MSPDFEIILDSLDVAEDRRRLDAFVQSGLVVPLEDVKAWVASWGTANELPRPLPLLIPSS